MNLALFVLGAAALSGLLVLLARHFGLVDDPASAPSRKLQSGPVPRIGGLVLACFAALEWSADPAAFAGWGSRPDLVLLGAGLLGAFLLGLLDDLWRAGLSPWAKGSLQLVAGALLVASGIFPGTTDAWSFAAWLLLALAAMNAAGTFDNADGALTLLGAGAFLPRAVGAALAGFLPWNLWLRSDASRPRAFLGDAGSQLLGLLLLCDPHTAQALWLPALDLARLAWVRTRSGSRPWVGDRRHLAHRLQARGLQPTTVAAVLALTAAPSVFLPAGFGAGATAALFVLALLLTNDPCPGPRVAG